MCYKQLYLKHVINQFKCLNYVRLSEGKKEENNVKSVLNYICRRVILRCSKMIYFDFFRLVSLSWIFISENIHCTVWNLFLFVLVAFSAINDSVSKQVILEIISFVQLIQTSFLVHKTFHPSSSKRINNLYLIRSVGVLFPGLNKPREKNNTLVIFSYFPYQFYQGTLCIKKKLN